MKVWFVKHFAWFKSVTHLEVNDTVAYSVDYANIDILAEQLAGSKSIQLPRGKCFLQYLQTMH